MVSTSVSGQSLVKSWRTLLEFFFDDRLIARQQVTGQRFVVHDPHGAALLVESARCLRHIAPFLLVKKKQRDFLDAHDRLERIHDFGLQIRKIELHHHGMRESG